MYFADCVCTVQVVANKRNPHSIDDLLCCSNLAGINEYMQAYVGFSIITSKDQPGRPPATLTNELSIQSVKFVHISVFKAKL